MAFMQCNFFSDVLETSVSINVIIPQDKKKQAGERSSERANKYPTLYLLHGIAGNHTTWMMKTSIERYVSSMGLAVVMPSVGRSFYTDMKNGYNYFSYITEELPEIVQSFFPLSEKREDTFVAGLSMGGYGAFKIGLRCPERYAAAASMSGVLDIAAAARENIDPSRMAEFKNIFGDLDTLKGSEDDVIYLANKVASSSGPKPKLYQCCGTEDFLYQNNIGFRDIIKDLGFDYTYEEGPGTHEWGYWDKMIQNVLKWLPIQK